MGWFSRMLSGRQTQPARVDGSPRSSEDRIHSNGYDPVLISGLKSDHRDLLELFSEVSRTLENGNYEAIPSMLVAFKTRLEGHLLAENYRFYSYLEETLSRDSENADLMRDFRKEMNTIARRVVHFIKQWEQSGINEASAPHFRRDLVQVGASLKQRIDREEQSLYPLYTRMS